MAAGNGMKVGRLWYGVMTSYPSPSEAVLALLRLLAFWTGPHPDRLDRLFRQSRLYSATEEVRSKWRSRRGPTTWGGLLVGKAIGSTLEFFDPLYLPQGRTVQVSNAISLNQYPHTCISLCPNKGICAIAEVCRGLTGGRSGEPFFLSAREAARRSGVNRTTASRRLSDLEWLGSSPTATSTEDVMSEIVTRDVRIPKRDSDISTRIAVG